MGRKEEIRKFVGRKIYILQSEEDSGRGKAMLANLRRGVGRMPGELPQLFGIVLLDMPEAFLSKSGEATEGEWACYTALTLYALHQQGHDGNRQMHTAEDVSIGRAMYKLVLTYEGDSNAEQRVMQRLQRLVTAVDRKELSYHLRGIVQLLKSNDIPINYEILAGDLYEMQCPDSKNRVCLRWGQDFYRGRNRVEDEKESAV